MKDESNNPKPIKVAITTHDELSKLALELKQQEGTSFSHNDTIIYLLRFHKELLPMKKALRYNSLIGLPTNNKHLEL